MKNSPSLKESLGCIKMLTALTFHLLTLQYQNSPFLLPLKRNLKKNLLPPPKSLSFHRCNVNTNTAIGPEDKRKPSFLLEVATEECIFTSIYGSVLLL